MQSLYVRRGQRRRVKSSYPSNGASATRSLDFRTLLLSVSASVWCRNRSRANAPSDRRKVADGSRRAPFVHRPAPTSLALTRSRYACDSYYIHDRDRIRALLSVFSDILGDTRWTRRIPQGLPLGEKAREFVVHAYVVRTLCLRVGAMGPTADAARIVHDAVCSRLKYWLTKWGSSNVRERKEGLHRGGLQVIVCELRATLSQGRFSRTAVVRLPFRLE